jgi:hypothetical protein
MLKLLKKSDLLQCGVVGCGRRRMTSRPTCLEHLMEQVRKVGKKKPQTSSEKKKKAYEPPKKASHLFQEVIDTNFPGKFQFRLRIHGSGDTSGAEVDAYLDTPTFALVVECDEHQHRPPRSKLLKMHVMWQPAAQAERYINLVYRLLEKPTIIIRFNPNDIRRFKVPLLDRLVELSDLIQSILDSPPTMEEMIRVNYMYFDKKWKEELEKYLQRRLCRMRRTHPYHQQ